MHLRLVAILPLLLATPLVARLPPLPTMSTAELEGYLPDGASVETRIDLDVTGDRLKDVVAVGRTEESRKLVVLAGYQHETDMGYRPIGQMSLDLSPLGKAALRMAGNVLLVEDLTGGTTAVSSLYRFRYDRPADRMRLIGDDVTLYSRTYAHGSTDISTNRLTGVQITKRSEINGEGENASLVPGKPTTRRVSRKPIYMEEAPDPAVTLGWGG